MRDLQLTQLTPALAPLALPLLGRAAPGLSADAWGAYVRRRASAAAKDPQVPPILALQDRRGVLLALADVSVEENSFQVKTLRSLLYVGHDLLRVTREEAGSLIGAHLEELAERLGCSSLCLGVELAQGGRLPDSLMHLLATPTASCQASITNLVSWPGKSDSVTQLPKAQSRRQPKR